MKIFCFTYCIIEKLFLPLHTDLVKEFRSLEIYNNTDMKIAELYWKMQMVQEYLRACLYMNGLDGENIRKGWKRGITNDTDYFIDINFEDILVTYDVEKKKVCDNFEVYNKDGVWLCVLNIKDYIKKEIE